jgi:hypothetical protein
VRRIVFRYVIPLLMFLSLFPIPSSAQGHETTATRPGERDLVATRMCNGLMLGRWASCRVYQASDGTKSLVWFGTFASDEEAKSAVKQWIQPIKVTHRDQAKDANGNVIGERIVGSGQDHKTGETSYVVIRRHILNYWRIESKSLPDAMQLDASIDASTPVGPLVVEKKH